jgi:4-hydroxy-3-methylbut-2-enyl diphosphate reductase
MPLPAQNAEMSTKARLGDQALRLLLAQPRGFCAGVEMAIRALDRAIELFGEPIYAFHQIVHNTFVVNSFEQRGVRFVDDLDSVPPGSTIVFSAHGVSPSIRSQAAQLDLRVVDATCPLVTKVHTEARRFASRGYTVVFIGHATHDETIGVLGEAPGQIQVIESVDDVRSISIPDPLRVAYLTQTTLGVDDAARIIAALRERFPRIEGPATEDICYATQNRQAAIRRVAVAADVIVVVGSINSSNSQRLVEVVASLGAKAYLVDSPKDVRPDWFEGASTIALTSGASVPEPLFAAVVASIGREGQVQVEKHGHPEEVTTFALPASVRARRSGQ